LGRRAAAATAAPARALAHQRGRRRRSATAGLDAPQCLDRQAKLFDRQQVLAVGEEEVPRRMHGERVGDEHLERGAIPGGAALCRRAR
jgi:hypothetical protein